MARPTHVDMHLPLFVILAALLIIFAFGYAVTEWYPLGVFAFATFIAYMLYAGYYSLATTHHFSFQKFLFPERQARVHEKVHSEHPSHEMERLMEGIEKHRPHEQVRVEGKAGMDYINEMSREIVRTVEEEERKVMYDMAEEKKAVIKDISREEKAILHDMDEKEKHIIDDMETEKKKMIDELHRMSRK